MREAVIFSHVRPAPGRRKRGRDLKKNNTLHTRVWGMGPQCGRSGQILSMSLERQAGENIFLRASPEDNGNRADHREGSVQTI